MVFVRVQMLTCKQIDSRVVLNEVTAPKGKCRDYQRNHLRTRKGFMGTIVALGLLFIIYYIWALETFDMTSIVYPYCWTWNITALYFIVSVAIHNSGPHPKIAPRTKILGKFKKNKENVQINVTPWSLGKSTALILFQTAFDVTWGAVVGYIFYFRYQTKGLYSDSIGERIVMGSAFSIAPVLLTLDLFLSQMVFVPLHFVFAITFLFLWVFVLWAYNISTASIGNCSSYHNATACWCSRTSVNSSDIVQCYNHSVGLCKWSEYGRCGWTSNPSEYLRMLPEELAMLEPPLVCGYSSEAAMENAIAVNGTHNQGHCGGDYPYSLYSITDPLFFLYILAMCGVLVFTHLFGIVLTCIREAACQTTMKPIAAAHRCFVIPEPTIDLRFVDETGDIPTE